MHITADGRRLELSRSRSQTMVVLYATSLFSASFEARCLRKVLVSGLVPPEVMNTRGVNEARSTSRMRSLYRFRLACSWQRYVAGSRGGGVVRGCVSIEDPDIKKFTL